MDNRKQFGKNITTLLLLIALMLPTVIQFSHIFDDHGHSPCEELSTHFHQGDTNCHICDFHLASFNYDIAEYPELSLPVVPIEIIESLSSLQIHLIVLTNTQLRAPPVFS